jgi:hypothetical protein
MNYDFHIYTLLSSEYHQGGIKHGEGEQIWIDKRKIDYVYSICDDHCVVGIGGKEIYLYDRLSRVLNNLGVQ